MKNTYHQTKADSEKRINDGSCILLFVMAVVAPIFSVITFIISLF